MQVDASSFRSLEEALLDPVVRASRRSLDALIADDFVEFGSSGGVFGKGHVVDSPGNLPDVVTPLAEFVVAPLSDSLVLVTYLSTTRLGDGLSRSARRSSLWVFRDARWQMRFHQGTVVATSD